MDGKCKSEIRFREGKVRAISPARLIHHSYSESLNLEQFHRGLRLARPRHLPDYRVEIARKEGGFASGITGQV